MRKMHCKATDGWLSALRKFVNNDLLHHIGTESINAARLPGACPVPFTQVGAQRHWGPDVERETVEEKAPDQLAHFTHQKLTLGNSVLEASFY